MSLPRPDVVVTPARDRDPEARPGAHDVVISKPGFATVRSYRVDGATTAEVVKDALDKVLADPRTAEDVK